MSEENSAPSGPIRITWEEANSAHVDDLLKRQMSMRGDPGVTRDRRQKWYYQNWIVLALAGMLGAFLAWAIIEPFFDDEIYIQGTISHLVITDSFTHEINLGREKDIEIAHAIVGSCEVNGQKILLLETLRETGPHGRARHADFGSLHNGDPVGFYVEFYQGPQTDVALALFVVKSPPPQSASRAAMTLPQLEARRSAASLLMFPTVAGLIGLLIGAVDGIVCRLPRRALLSGAIGLVVGFVGGFVIHFLGNIVYEPLHELAMRQMSGDSFGPFAFLVQMVARSLAWCLIGVAMGLGQGIALRSSRLLIYGLVGGLIGGLFGGLFFDPIDLILLGANKPSAAWSRLIGFMVIGLSVGAMIGLVELLARDAWLRMTQGPLAGKEFLIFKETMMIGSAPSSDLYLFNDAQVAKHHATIRAVGDEIEIERRDAAYAVLLNNRPITRARLRHGDNVTIGRATFVFQRRKS